MITLHYSPCFNGRTYIDYDATHKHPKRCLLGESVVSTAGLLSRFELVLGINCPDITDTERSCAYYEALRNVITPGHPLYASWHNDYVPSDDDATAEDVNAEGGSFKHPHLAVTTELLRWRDALLLAGWDGKAPLPEGKLATLHDAEPHADARVHGGSADRWCHLLGCVPQLQQAGLRVEVHCPSVLLPPLIKELLSGIGANFLCEYQRTMRLKTEHCRILTADEPRQAYEWLSQQPVLPHQLVVCADTQRLDAVLRCFGKPLTGSKAQIGCHMVTDDIRSVVDTPDSLIWLDCNGDYRYTYPYDFISATEAEQLPPSIVYPTREECLLQVSRHYTRLLNEVKDEVTLVTAATDLGEPLAEHPVVSELLYGQPSALVTTKIAVSSEPKGPGEYALPMQSKQHEQHFQRQVQYTVGDPLPVSPQVTMSYSTLDQLVQFPFNYLVEKLALMREPTSEDDLRTVKGNVAHRTVEFMVNAQQPPCQLNLALFDDCLDKALKDKGQDLLRPENQFELEEFKIIMRQSITTLDQIIRQQGLTIVGSEVNVPDNPDSDSQSRPTLPLGRFGNSVANIDLLLTDAQGKYVVFDFKFSSSENTYPGKLKENKSVQFTFYSEILRAVSKPVCAMGYYLFPLATLFVPEGPLGSQHLRGAHIQSVPLGKDAVHDAYTALQNAYEKRIEQLRSGIVEEAEQMPKADIPYHQACSQPGAELFPLDDAYQHTELKGSPYQPDHIVLKNQIR